MEQDFLSHSSERFPGATDGVCSILRCRRILGARKLLVYVRIVVAAIFDFMRRKIGEVLFAVGETFARPLKNPCTAGYMYYLAVTRSVNNLNITCCRLATGQRRFAYKGVKIWNGLRNHLRTLATLFFSIRIYFLRVLRLKFAKF